MIKKRIEKEFHWFYPWIKNLSKRLLSLERIGHTFQPTALAHEVLAKLMVWKGHLDNDSPDSLKAVSKTIARQTLIDSGRKNQNRLRYQEHSLNQTENSSFIDSRRISDLVVALEQLRESDPDLADFVELRFMDGMTLAEAADQIGWSERTAARKWNFAKAWLKHAVSD